MAWRRLNIITVLILNDVILQTWFHPPPPPDRQLFTDDGNEKIKSMSWELMILYYIITMKYFNYIFRAATQVDVWSQVVIS